MKKLFLSLVCLAVFLSGTGCSRLAEYARSRTAAAREGAVSSADGEEAPDSAEVSAAKTDNDVTYTNSYLGFSYTVPKNWWVYSLNEDNFSPDPQATEESGLFDIAYGEDAGMNYSFIDLVSFGNLRDSRRDNHIGFDISAETLDGVGSLARYMEYYENFMLEPGDDTSYKLLDSGSVEINGTRYETRGFEVIREKDNYIYLTWTRSAANNYYLTIKANYWPENKNAPAFIADTLSKAMP